MSIQLLKGRASLLSFQPLFKIPQPGVLSSHAARRVTAGAVQARREISNRQVSGSPQLTASDLHVAAKLSRLSEWCYKDDVALRGCLESQGFKLVGAGYTHFTRWYVADGIVDSGADVSSSEPHDGQYAGLPGSHDHQVDRIVVVRGVVWRAKEVEVMKLWQGLSRFWQVPFAADLTRPPSLLFAHAGVSDMAQQLFELTQQHITQGTGGRMYFTGHSLGGALSALLCCLHRLHSPGQSQELTPPSLCYTYGSPLVLTTASGAAKEAALKALCLPSSAFRHFVLNNDPIPGSMLGTMDPSMMLSRQLPSLRHVMDFQEQIFGRSLIPMLADAVGQVYYIHWKQGKLQVRLLSPYELRDHLQPGMMHMMEQPMKAVRAILDHHHTAYTAELQSAAYYLEREKKKRATTM